jgi:hypothetical protein
LVALGEFSERGKGVGAELVEDTRDEFGEFLVLAVSVDGEGVRWDSGVDCKYNGTLAWIHPICHIVSHNLLI